MVTLGILPVALTAARCSRDSRLARALLFWMMRGPPMASSMGRLSLVSLGFWLICTGSKALSASACASAICLTPNSLGKQGLPFVA